MDSVSFQTFARLRDGWVPKKVALQQSISRISEGTWEKINGELLSRACALGVERGQVVRVDSTVTESMIHEPTDSSLLWDSVRVIVRLCERADALAGPLALDYHNHRRRAKKRMRAIEYTRGQVLFLKLFHRQFFKLSRARKSVIGHFIVSFGLIVESERTREMG
jgi:transposase, IS5 family